MLSRVGSAHAKRSAGYPVASLHVEGRRIRLRFQFNQHSRLLNFTFVRIVYFWVEWDQHNLVFCDVFQNLREPPLLVSFRSIHEFVVVVRDAGFKFANKVCVAKENFLGDYLFKVLRLVCTSRCHLGLKKILST